LNKQKIELIENDLATQKGKNDLLRQELKEGKINIENLTNVSYKN